MTEFKYVFISQILAMFFLVGAALGSLLGHPVYHTKIVRIMPEEIYPKLVAERALRSSGVLWAYKDEECGDYYFIDKQGRPCKLFREVGE